MAVPANIDRNAIKSFMVDHGLLEQLRPNEMLFDLYLDPVERVNVIGEAAYQSVKEVLALRLNQWMEETKDPLLNGHMQDAKDC